MREVALLAIVVLGVAAFAGTASGAGTTAPRRARATSPVAGIAASAPLSVNDFEDASRWSAVAAEGVHLDLAPDSGASGRSLRLDVRFERGTGYAVARRAVSLDLPGDYFFRFQLRGTVPRNHLEFKLVDSTGQNVWWHVRRDLEYPSDWRTLRTRKNHLSFAWGPAGGGEIRHVAFVEFAVTAGEGGAGSVWLDDLELVPVEPDSLAPPPSARASSARPGHTPALALDGRSVTTWESAAKDTLAWIELDLGRPREFSAARIEWEPGRHARDYDLSLSADGRSWALGRAVRGGNGRTDRVFLPEAEARWLRIEARSPDRGIAVRDVAVETEGDGTPESFFTTLAGKSPRGTFPRPYYSEQCGWAVIGLDGGRDEALLSEDGMLETGRKQFSLEPFLEVDGRLVTWADARTEQSLVDGRLPMPRVRWLHPDASLEVSAFADGDTSRPLVLARYRVSNPTPRPRQVTLHLAARPFQVNPPWQHLATRGGVAPIREIALAGGVLSVNGEPRVAFSRPPSAFDAASLDQDEVGQRLGARRLVPAQRASDAQGFASGVASFVLDLPANGAGEVLLSVALRPGTDPVTFSAEIFGLSERVAATRWRERLGLVRITAPESAREAIETLEAQVGWILVNRDGPSLQPGSRSYDRSWIRDGSLTSSALLRLGINEPVARFINWFAPQQYENGKVPCCADSRGPDPVTENDSHGQLIFLIAEYYRYTGDRALVERHWPRVVRAIAHMDSLRRERRGPEWRTQERSHYFGLLMPSISHEGYPNPVHSYWDDFFAYRGYRDAAYLARVLGLERESATIAAARDTFARDLAASIAAAMALHHVDYIPGCADLGDFDATSTTVALCPTGAADLLPAAALRTTFERYWEFFEDRRAGRIEWEAFTPYETRVIGSFVRLGWRERSAQATEYFLAHRRPAGWRQWSEVVHRDPSAPRFLGDLPHTWVGSDFVRSVLDGFAYERDRDSALVIGAGVPWTWAAEDSGVAIHGLRTPYGPLGFTMRAVGDSVVVVLEAGTRVPPGGLVIVPPARQAFHQAWVDRDSTPVTDEGGVIVRRLPARVVLRP